MTSRTCVRNARMAGDLNRRRSRSRIRNALAFPSKCSTAISCRKGRCPPSRNATRSPAGPRRLCNVPRGLRESIERGLERVREGELLLGRYEDGCREHAEKLAHPRFRGTVAASREKIAPCAPAVRFGQSKLRRQDLVENFDDPASGRDFPGHQRSDPAVALGDDRKESQNAVGIEATPALTPRQERGDPCQAT